MEDSTRFSIVSKLVGLSRADWKYSDIYLREAEAALSLICPREQFRGMLHQRDRVKKLASELRHAIQQGDWQEAERLAAAGIELRRRVAQDSRLLSLAETVYGQRSLHASSTALALSGGVAQPARILEREISRLSSDLRTLAEGDGSLREFYGRRATELDRMAVDIPEDPPPRVDPSELRDAALTAAADADFAAALRIVRSAARSGRSRAIVSSTGYAPIHL